MNEVVGDFDSIHYPYSEYYETYKHILTLYIAITSVGLYEYQSLKSQFTPLSALTYPQHSGHVPLTPQSILIARGAVYRTKIF